MGRARRAAAARYRRSTSAGTDALRKLGLSSACAITTGRAFCGEAGSDASPMRNRKCKNADKNGDQPVLDISKAMAAVYFSYEPDPEAMAEADPEEQALVAQEQAKKAEAAARQRKKREQAKLDAALMID